RPAAGDHAMPGDLVALDPVLPAERGHPEAVDQHDGPRRIGSGHGIRLLSFLGPGIVSRPRGTDVGMFFGSLLAFTSSSRRAAVKEHQPCLSPASSSSRCPSTDSAPAKA